jgi:crotonobetainyl-CoA:carnitine CoA-transferase CaiB-like acyl-CoA transferase
LLHTSYAWIHTDGRAGDWEHVDAQQYGLSPFYRMYKCADESWLFLAAVSKRERETLLAAVGERSRSAGDPEADSDTLTKLLEGHCLDRPAAQLFAELDGAGVPVEIVDEEFCRTIFDDADAHSAQLVSETWAGNVGRFEDPGLLVNLAPATSVIQRGPCLCGEHSGEILREHGYSDDEIEALVSARAILDAPVERV